MKPQLNVSTNQSTANDALNNRMAKSGSKREKLIRLVSRKNGSRTNQLEKELGWQSHTVRAAICGLRKTGIKIETRKTKSGQIIYRLIPADGKTGADK